MNQPVDAQDAQDAPGTPDGQNKPDELATPDVSSEGTEGTPDEGTGGDTGTPDCTDDGSDDGYEDEADEDEDEDEEDEEDEDETAGAENATVSAVSDHLLAQIRGVLLPELLVAMSATLRAEVKKTIATELVTAVASQRRKSSTARKAQDGGASRSGSAGRKPGRPGRPKATPGNVQGPRKASTGFTASPLNPKQQHVLDLLAQGQTDYKQHDRRVVNALERRGYVRYLANSVKLTQKGKRLINRS